MQLADFLTRFDDVEECADGLLVHCPAHSDSRPSLRVTVSDRGKVLLRCRAGCETSKVVESMGLSMYDLATMKPGEVTFSPATSQDVPASAADVARLQVQLDAWAKALCDQSTSDASAIKRYAEDRFGLTLDDMARLGLGAAGDLPGTGPRLVVPFRDADGIARGYQARALISDAAVRWLGPKSPEGASWAKVGYFPGTSGWDEVIICEGPGDALTACAVGYDVVMVRGAGLASNPAVISAIHEIVGERVAILAGDGDPSGRRFSSTLAQSLVDDGGNARILDVPEGLDLTDWRERDGVRFATNLIRAIMHAEPVTATTAALSARDEGRYPLTDLGNARFVRDFVKASGSGVRYSPEAGFFLLKDGVWRPDRLDRTRAYVQEAADKVAELAARLLEAAIPGTDAEKHARRWGSWARHSQSSRGIDAALKELQALPEVAADVNDFDRHPDLLACRNGVVNLRTGDLRPHDPELLLTRRVNIDYDANARAPRWEKFLDEVFPSHPDLPHFIRRLVGYGITGRTDEQAFAVLWGTGANGKSVFTDTLTEVFRELTVTTPFSTFEDRGSGGIPNDLAALKGARLVMAAEGEQGRPMAEAVLKRVTGRDLIAARFMRKEFFEFRPTFLLLLATNFKPQFRGQDEGLWRRVKLIPWERYFAPHERDHQLGAALLEEAPGILAWAVRGSREWYANGLGDPEVIRKSTTEYRETSDALAGFFPGAYVKDPVAGRVAGKTLFEHYLAWADDENLPPRDRWTRKTFYAALEERGLVKRSANVGVAFEGIRRARQTDFAPDHDELDEVDRAAHDAPPHSKSTTPTITSGPSLDDVL